MDDDGGLVGSVGTVEEPVERGQECLSAGNAEACVLTLADEGLEGFGVHAAFAEKHSAVVIEELELAWGKFHGSVDAIEDPAEDFLASVPHSLALQDELLVGDGVLPVLSHGCWGREDLVDGVEEGSAVVAQGVRVRGLEQAAVVVDVALDEVGDAVAAVVREWARGEGGEGEEVGVDGVEHVGLKWVWREVGLLLQELGNVAASFSGGAEKGGAGGPSHLEGR